MKNLFAIALLWLFWLFAIPSIANQSVLEQTHQLDEQQAALQNRLARIDQLSNAQGRYVLIRDNYFHSDKGVKAMALKWFGNMQTWTTQWYEILAVVENAPDLTSLQLQSNIREHLRVQQQQWLELKSQGDSIRFRTEDGLEQIKKIPAFGDGFIAGYEAHTRFFNEKVKALSEILQASQFAFNVENRELWDALLSETEHAVIRRLEQAVLNYPHLREALRQIEMAFRVEREVEPLVKIINDRYNTVRDHVYGKRVFQAEDAVAALQHDGDAALNAIRSNDIDPVFTSDAEATIQNWMTVGRQLFHNATAPFPRSLLVKQNFFRESSELSAKCKDMNARQTVDCELLRTLLQIPLTEIDGMTTAQLKYFEGQIAKIKRGPLS